MKKVLLTAISLLVIATSSAALPFDTVVSDAHSAGMGDMQGIISRGASAVLGNPAALHGIGANSVEVMTRNWYDTGLQSYAIAYARPLGNGALGLAWHRFGQGDLWTENLLAIGGACPLPSPTSSWRPTLGSTVKLMQIAVPGYHGDDYAGDCRSYALDLALRLENDNNISLAWVGENLLRGVATLLDGGIATTVAPRKNRVGLSYNWREYLLFGAEHLKREGFDGRVAIGFELNFFQAFYLRGGGGGGWSSAGFGLESEWWRLDAAFEAQGRLGTSLIFSFTTNFNKREEH